MWIFLTPAKNPIYHVLILPLTELSYWPAGRRGRRRNSDESREAKASPMCICLAFVHCESLNGASSEGWLSRSGGFPHEDPPSVWGHDEDGGMKLSLSKKEGQKNINLASVGASIWSDGKIYVQECDEDEGDSTMPSLSFLSTARIDSQKWIFIQSVKLKKVQLDLSWICCPDGTPCGRSRGWWAWCTRRRRRAGWCRSTGGSTPFVGRRRSAMTNTGPVMKLSLRLFLLPLTDTSRTSSPQWLNFPGLGLSSALPLLSLYPGLASLSHGTFLLFFCGKF